MWLEDNNSEKCPPLQKDLSVDILIIGGGITGINIAYQLKDSNLNVCLVERNKIGEGVTSRTTGKLTYLQELIYSKIAKGKSLSTAKEYLNSQVEAIKIVKDIIKTNNIDCNFEKVDSYVFTNKEKDIKSIYQERDILRKLGVKVEEYSKIPYEIESIYTIKVNQLFFIH